MQTSYDTISDGNNTSGIEAIRLILRRKWLVITIFLIGTCLTLIYCFSLPPIYRSSTLILVEPQSIPPSYVSTTVTTGVQERLHTLRQQITSRTHLEHIINKFKIRDELRDIAYDSPINRLIKFLKNKSKPFLISWGLYSNKPDLAPARAQGVTELDISRMRNNIQVQIVGRDRNRAFTVSYSGREPVTVMQITNTLSSFFIEENLKVRTRIAETTTEFLEEELSAAEKDLSKQEKALLAFKETNMGSLPSQMTANINKLDRLQLELQMLNESLATAEEKAIFYEQNMMSTTPTSPMLGDAPADPRIKQLEQLRERLAVLRSQFNENYPDIRLLKNEIRELETHLISGVSSQTSGSGNLDATANSQRTQWEAQLFAVRQDILAARTRRDRVRGMIDQYEKMTEQTFQNEQKISQLTRTYETSRKNYEDLLAKRLNAKISENLEKRQKSEQFRIVDPANLPTRPYKPNRLQIISLGSLLSLVVGAGIAFLSGQLKAQGIDKPANLLHAFGLPVLTTISKDKVRSAHGRLVTLQEPESLNAEQYRILYTKIESKRSPSQNIFAISSAVAGEGKTITSLNLAIVIARDFGKKTLLLEGDFKRPALAPYLETDLHSGLVDILGAYPHGNGNGHGNALPLSDVIVPFAHENLSVLPAMKSVENSTSLLSSTHMRDLLVSLKQQYDYILIDAPPVLPLSDMNIFREVVDGILFVVRANRTPLDTVARALDSLETDKLLGFVLNDLQQSLTPYEYNKTKRERVLRA